MGDETSERPEPEPPSDAAQAPSLAPKPVFSPPRPSSPGVRPSQPSLATPLTALPGVPRTPGTPPPPPLRAPLQQPPATPSPLTAAAPPALQHTASAPPLPQAASSPPPFPAHGRATPVPESLRPPPPSSRALGHAPHASDVALVELRARFEQQGRELAATRNELASTRSALAQSEVARTRLERTLSEERAERESYAQRLRVELAEAHGRVVDELRARVRELEQSPAAQPELEARIRELEQSLAAKSELEAGARAAAESGARNGDAGSDDLKRLRGVGPAFERALRAQGVTSYAQIAAWNDEDIEKMARALKLKAERIRRDDWVGAARSLLSQPENA